MFFVCAFFPISFVARRNYTEATTEKGTLQLRKTVNATPTSVGFVRTRNLIDHITDLRRRYLVRRAVREHPGFRNEIWIKIGVRMK